MATTRVFGTVERRVYFYRLLAGSGPPRPQFNPILAAELIEQLTFLNGHRYMDIEDGNALCAWSIPTTNHVKLRLGVIRRSGLPDIEELGNITPLGISDSQGLLEMIHVVFFPNDIVGAEFNFYGPRVSRLSDYFHAKCANGLPLIKFLPLLRQDIQEQLSHLGPIRVAQIRLHRSQFDIAQEADENIAQAFRACAAASGAENVEIIFRPESYSRNYLGEHFFNSLKRLIGISEIREGAQTFKIEAFNNRTNKIEKFDLLRDQFVTSRRVLKLPGRQRGVDSAAMFQIIEEAYVELRDQLERAAGVEI